MNNIIKSQDQNSGNKITSFFYNIIKNYGNGEFCKILMSNNKVYFGYIIGGNEDFIELKISTQTKPIIINCDCIASVCEASNKKEDGDNNDR